MQFWPGHYTKGPGDILCPDGAGYAVQGILEALMVPPEEGFRQLVRVKVAESSGFAILGL
jgi:hypothetical protein